MTRVASRRACALPGRGHLVALLMLLLAAAGAAGAGQAGAGLTAVQKLERMASAMRSLSYRGTLVYLHDNRLETLRIEHRIENGRAHEHLVSLNGPVRTVTRENDRVTCDLASSHPISVKPHGVGRDLIGSRVIDTDRLEPHYLVHPLGSARVAGRQSEVIGVIPRDNLRYGYRFFLDRDSGLPLKSDLMGETAQPIEQVMFTSLELLGGEEEALPEAASPAVDVEADGEADAGAEAAPVQARGWKLGRLPPGFRLAMQDSWRDAAGSEVQHFLLSDGLASVSVYVENGEQEGLEGPTRIGAVHAVGGRVAGHQVTVVGEVPAGTVSAILAGLRPAEEGE